MVSTFFIGLTASMLHVISGPDHLAAVTPLAIESKRKAWKIGLMWGLGHILGMLALGMLVLFFKDYISVEKISNFSESIVGFLLILLGLWTLFKLYRKADDHSHPHFHIEHDTPVMHIHAHKHTTKTHYTSKHKHKHQNSSHKKASFFIGFVHGLAGFAHFFLLLPILSFKSQIDSIQYFIGFGTGSILSMSLYALILGLTAAGLETKNKKYFSFYFRFIGGIATLIVGLYWLWTS